jgi:glycerol-3-phosphate acyltransferase PlsX
VVLKASESLGEFVSRTLREEVTRNPWRKAGAVLLRSAFEDLKKRMDYSEYGGAPLLGVNGGCIVCHGRSNPKAIKNAIRVARDFALNRVDTKIRDKIGDLHSREHDSALAAERATP